MFRRTERASALLKLAALFAAIPCWGVGEAQAYELKRTESGTPIRWYRGSVAMRIEPSRGCGPSRAELQRGLEIAIEAWRGIGGSPDVVIDRGSGPPASVGYDPREPAGNGVYIVCDGWPHGETLAVTVATHDAASGALLDADIVINGAASLALLDEAEDARSSHYDLASILTHEVGHVLGLDESHTRSATMWPTTARGDTRQRSIEPDDENGIVSLYGAGSPAPPVATCAAASHRRGDAVNALFLGLFWVVLARRRLRRRIRSRVQRSSSSSPDFLPSAREARRRT